MPSVGSPLEARQARLDADRPGHAWLTSMNITSWGNLREAIKHVDSHLVVVQETKLPKARLSEASQSMARQGWKLVAAPAAYKHSGLSGGCAILAKGHIDVWHKPGEEDVFPGRAVAAHVRLPRLGLITVYSVYLAVEGAAQAQEINSQVFKALVMHMMSHRQPWICMGDWNMDPKQVGLLPWVQRAGAVVLAPGTATCHTPGCDNVRDFAVMDIKLALVQEGATSRAT